MGWNLEEDREMLWRIVAFLYALAGIAERASCLSGPARRRVLCFLCPAEAVARDFIIGLTHDHDAPHALSLLSSIAYGGGPADALRLAQSFRALAAMLAMLVALAPAPAPAPAHRRVSRRGMTGIGAPVVRARASSRPRHAAPTGVRLGGSPTLVG